MWQIFALGSIISRALGGVGDKAATVREPHIHGVVAAFWRNLLVLFYVTLAGYLGLFGAFGLVLTWPIIVLGAMTALTAYVYSYVLKRVEATGIFIQAYLAPIAFLAIDLFVVHAALQPAQIVGVIILTAGGFTLAFNVRTHHLKREFTPMIIALFAYWLVYDGAQYYLFKYMHETTSVSATNFLMSVWLVAVSVMFVHLVLARKAHLLFGRAARDYIPAIVVSKMFDAGAMVLWLYALSFAAVSQVSALNAIGPLVMLVIAYVVQKETRFNIRERIDRTSLSSKIFATALLCLGLFLVT